MYVWKYCVLQINDTVTDRQFVMTKILLPISTHTQLGSQAGKRGKVAESTAEVTACSLYTAARSMLSSIVHSLIA